MQNFTQNSLQYLCSLIKDKLGDAGGVHVGNAAPASTKMLWIDTENGSVPKYYDGSSWVCVPAVWG